MEKTLNIHFTLTQQGITATVIEPESGEQKEFFVTNKGTDDTGKLTQNLIGPEIGSWLFLWLDEMEEQKEENV